MIKKFTSAAALAIALVSFSVPASANYYLTGPKNAYAQGAPVDYCLFYIPFGVRPFAVYRVCVG